MHPPKQDASARPRLTKVQQATDESFNIRAQQAYTRPLIYIVRAPKIERRPCSNGLSTRFLQGKLLNPSNCAHRCHLHLTPAFPVRLATNIAIVHSKASLDRRELVLCSYCGL